VTIDGAQGILFNVRGGKDLSLFEVNEAAEIIRQTAHPEVNIIFGAVIDEEMEDEIQITVIATGFEGGAPRRSVMTSATTAVRRPVAQASVPAGGTAQTQSEAVEFPVRVFDPDDLDIPTFMRKHYK
jgi:cell division protein FtsZ